MIRTDLIVMVLFLLAGACSSSKAEKRQPFYFYGEASAGAGVPFQFKGSLQCLFLGHHNIGIGYIENNRQDPNMPLDFVPSNFLNIKPFKYPQQIIDGIGITYGYAIYPNKSKEDQIRLEFRGGILIGNYATPINYTKRQLLLSDNYDYQVISSPAIAFMVQPTLELTPSRAFGVSIGLYGLINDRLNGAGVSIGLLFGRVGSHPRSHHKLT